MKASTMRSGIFSLLAFVSLALLLVVRLQTVVAVAAQSTPVEEVDDEPTCSLDPSSKSDCSIDGVSSSSENLPADSHGQVDLTRQVISLTDDTFDRLTLSSTPSTWLIMFKTNSCAICKKATPVLEDLSIDIDIASHNDRELEAISKGKVEPVKEQTSEADKEGTAKPKGPVYVYEESTVEGGEIPRGPIYIATIDAGWSGRDTTKRFGVDATPTILLLRNEGYGEQQSNIDSRSYYVYRGQRATYPLRNFVLGGYAVRKKFDMPPPLSDEERKPQSYWGRVHDMIISPSAKWAGGIVGKILLAWFTFIAVLGLFMRVHNYAWGENADDDDKEREIEKERAQGRKEHNDSTPTADERSARRQKAMWARKAENRAKFAANREARKKGESGDDSDDDYEGVGFSVKKSDVIQKNAKKKDTTSAAKSKDN